jgi:hypothetical protein
LPDAIFQAAGKFMPRHHCIISGTGRTGTTFLVQLLSALGLPTGFSDPRAGLYANCNAGMEWDLRAADAPYIVKSPFLCDYLDAAIQGADIVIDHAFVPVRDLFQAAQSRRDVSARTDAAAYPHGIPGGLWHTHNPAAQELVLTLELYKLINALTKHDIPTTLLDFPRLVHDPDYLYRKLSPLLHGIDFDFFERAYRVVVRPELVHEFNAPIASAAQPAGKATPVL